MNSNQWWKRKLVENVYSCAWCDATFKDPSFIRYHVRAAHPFHCNSCLKALPSLPSFESHAETCTAAAKVLEYYRVKKLLNN